MKKTTKLDDIFGKSNSKRDDEGFDVVNLIKKDKTNTISIQGQTKKRVGRPPTGDSLKNCKISFYTDEKSENKIKEIVGKTKTPLSTQMDIILREWLEKNYK